MNSSVILALRLLSGVLPAAAGRPILAVVSCTVLPMAAQPELPGIPTVEGPYLDWRQWAPVLALFLLWVGTLRWVDVDAGALRLNRRQWNAALFLSGIIGFLILFGLPGYWFGYIVLLLGYTVPVALYVTLRNQRVSAKRRVFTEAHLRRLPKQLAVGLIRLLVPQAASAGPPITLLGKSVTGSEAGEEVSRHVASSRAYRAVRELVYDAIERKATDVHLEASSGDYIARVRVDGELKPAGSFDRRTGAAVINVVKVLAALDITDRRRSQDGSFRAEIEDRTVDLRVATQGTQHGEKLSIRILDPARSFTTLTSLGLRKGLQEKIRDFLTRQHGLFLVGGPTGAGKTTTLYAALRIIDTKQKNVITVEDPVEYNMPGINQIEVNTKGGQTFAGALKHLLRQDPDVLLIGEIRDPETAAIATQAANTGHVVLSTIHANDAVTALYRLLELGVERHLASGSITGILAQRLVRQLCPDCRIPFEPDEQTLNELGLPAGKVATLYRARKGGAPPCSTCNGSGYSGRTGVFEFLDITPDIRKMIRDRESANAILAAARQEGLLLMREEGLGLVGRGITSLEELDRVLRETPA